MPSALRRGPIPPRLTGAGAAVDIITAALLGVAFGVAFWGWGMFVYPASPPLTTGFPPLGA